MSKKRKIGVVLYENAAQDLGGILGGFLKRGDAVGPYVNCKEIEPNGPFFHMTLEMDGAGNEFEVQIPHSAVKAIICAAELKQLGFV